jgi:hypothetical protein
MKRDLRWIIIRGTRFLAIAVAGYLPIGGAHAVPWMYQPTNQPGSLGNNYYEYQNYGSSYYHDGIDVLKSTGGVPVYSVSSGWMTHETAGTMYGGLMIGDQYAAGATGWLYWHLPNSTYPFNVGDRINEGDYIGDIAYWSVYNFNRVHFNRVVGTGGLPWNWYSSIDNPLNYLNPGTDPQTPVIYDAVGTDLLAFCVNNTSTYRNPNALSGDIDIIAKIGDRFWNNQWEIIPYRIEYSILSPLVNDQHTAFLFSGLLAPDNTINVVYKDDAVCNTGGNYTERNFFFILTNNDGDSTVESTDAAGAWHTAGYPSGTYTIRVTAADAGGNVVSDSMNVTMQSPAPQNVSVTMTPTSSLQIPASGGSFTYTVQIRNLGASTATCEGWIGMTYPSGASQQILLRSLSLPAGGSITRNLTQTVGANLPNGTYYYEAKLGYSPFNVWDSDGFTFTKGLDASAGGIRVEETRLYGWDEIPFEETRMDPAATASSVVIHAYPNPFNPETVISFSLPAAAQVSLEVFDLSGQRVAEPAKGWRQAGTYEVTLNGSKWAAGVYIYRFRDGANAVSGKLLLLK